jgi:hypothetical protein
VTDDASEVKVEREASGASRGEEGYAMSLWLEGPSEVRRVRVGSRFEATLMMLGEVEAEWEASGVLRGKEGYAIGGLGIWPSDTRTGNQSFCDKTVKRT